MNRNSLAKTFSLGSVKIDEETGFPEDQEDSDSFTVEEFSTFEDPTNQLKWCYPCKCCFSSDGIEAWRKAKGSCPACRTRIDELYACGVTFENGAKLWQQKQEAKIRSAKLDFDKLYVVFGSVLNTIDTLLYHDNTHPTADPASETAAVNLIRMLEVLTDPIFKRSVHSRERS